MAKILLWNVPSVYTEILLEEARRLAPELEVTAVDSERDPIVEAYRLIIDAYDKGEPFTTIVAFLHNREYRQEERRNYELTFVLLRSFTHADYMGYPEEILPSMQDFMVEFKSIFHPGKEGKEASDA